MIFKFATRKTANIADTNTKCKIWVWNARLENLPIFAESLEQPAHISQLKNTEIQKYLYIWIYTMAYDIFIVSVCLHLKKWIWEEILSRESGGKWNLKQNGGTKQNLYKNGTNITYLPPSPLKSNQIVICKFHQTTAAALLMSDTTYAIQSHNHQIRTNQYFLFSFTLYFLLCSLYL